MKVTVTPLSKVTDFHDYQYVVQRQAPAGNWVTQIATDDEKLALDYANSPTSRKHNMRVIDTQVPRQILTSMACDFDPAGIFSSPADALAQIHRQPDPLSALLALIAAHIATDEGRFAAEVMRDFIDTQA